MTLARLAACSLAVVLTAAPTAVAQNNGGPFFPGTGGVYVDPSGVLRQRQIDRDRRAPKRSGEIDTAYISLPKLFAAAGRHLRDGEEIPPPLRYLDGLTSARLLFLDGTGDLILAGPREELDLSDPLRPVGAGTGAPAIHLDDLVLALRTFTRPDPARAFGCSIDLPPDWQGSLGRASRQVGAIRNNAVQVADHFARAIGLQPVRILGIDDDTRMALACLEADWTMKQFALGLERPPVRAVKSQMQLMRPGDKGYARFWFTQNYLPVVTNPDQTVFELRGPGVKVLASDSPTANDSDPGKAATLFAERMTEHFPELAADVASFAELRNFADLSVLAALIRADRLAEKAGWDYRWAMDDAGYPVPRMPVAKSAPALVNFKRSGRMIFLIGGVEMSPGAVADAENRRLGNGEWSVTPRSLEGDGWSLVVGAPKRR